MDSDGGEAVSTEGDVLELSGPGPRVFFLARMEDETGTSGTGLVAEGVEFSDGTVALRWRTRTSSTAVYDSLAAVREIHGHNGKTQILYEIQETRRAKPWGRLTEDELAELYVKLAEDMQKNGVPRFRRYRVNPDCE